MEMENYKFRFELADGSTLEVPVNLDFESLTDTEVEFTASYADGDTVKLTAALMVLNAATGGALLGRQTDEDALYGLFDTVAALLLGDTSNLILQGVDV